MFRGILRGIEALFIDNIWSFPEKGDKVKACMHHSNESMMK